MKIKSSSSLPWTGKNDNTQTQFTKSKSLFLFCYGSKLILIFPYQDILKDHKRHLIQSYDYPAHRAYK